MKIKVLPPEVVNQIAAGEVVERPFSVVKELVENSLDAGARRVHVEIQDGGRALIRVRDDGSGMSADDLALAFVGHATSKLGEASDLEHIASLGFRGEALASIGSISRARIVSRTHDESSGHEVSCTGGAVDEVRPSGAAPGTVIEIADLFFNTPARRAFLKTPQAEKARIQDLIIRLSLAHLEVDFTLIADGRETVRLPKGEGMRARIKRAFGAQVAGGLIEVSSERDGYRVEGWAGDPDTARRDSKLELLFVNGRLAADRSTVHAVRQAYRAYLMPKRYPVYFLNLVLPPVDVDVNVHPTKAEVRFRDSRRACGVLHDAVRRGLEQRGGPAAAAPSLEVGADRPKARTGFPDLPSDLFGRAAPPPMADSVRERPPGRTASGSGQPPRTGESSADLVAPPTEPSGDPTRPNPFADVAHRRFLQVMNLYLVLEIDEAMMVVDQHALHERVVFEQLTNRSKNQNVKIQRLLMPEVMDLQPVDKAYLLDAAEALAEGGFLLEDFGGNSIAIQGIPAVLNKARPSALVESFLLGDDDGDARPRAKEAVLERFHSRACRSSVMSGDSLTDQEIEALLLEAAKLDHPHNCPHGRPTVLTFDRAELEKYFRRRL